MLKDWFWVVGESGKYGQYQLLVKEANMVILSCWLQAEIVTFLRLVDWISILTTYINLYIQGYLVGSLTRLFEIA